MKYAAAITVFSLICLGSLVSADENEDAINYIKGIVDKCKTKVQTPDEVFNKIITGEFDKGGADEVAQCHINCMMEEFGALKDGHKEAFEIFKSHIDEAKAKEHLEKCQMETGANECETGYKVFLCLKANADKIFKAK